RPHRNLPFGVGLFGEGPGFRLRVAEHLPKHPDHVAEVVHRDVVKKHHPRGAIDGGADHVGSLVRCDRKGCVPHLRCGCSLVSIADSGWAGRVLAVSFTVQQCAGARAVTVKTPRRLGKTREMGRTVNGRLAGEAGGATISASGKKGYATYERRT